MSRPQLGGSAAAGALHPRRSYFDLSYTVKGSYDMGILYPVMTKECMPGDNFKLGIEAIVRMNPLIHPLMHEVNIRFDTFFVPYRLVFTDGESDDPDLLDTPDPDDPIGFLCNIDTSSKGIFSKFLTGGRQGTFSGSIPPVVKGTNGEVSVDTIKNAFRVGGLLDHLGYEPVPASYSWSDDMPAELMPSDLPPRAYYFVWNEYYRDKDLQGMLNRHAGLPRDISNAGPSYAYYQNVLADYTGSGNYPSYSLCRVNWAHDYFVTARPSQQRGSPAAVPSASDILVSLIGQSLPLTAIDPDDNNIVTFSTGSVLVNPGDQSALNAQTYSGTGGVSAGSPISVTIPTGISGNVPSDTPLFTVTDLRYATQLQKWRERNMRGGFQLYDFLLQHYGVCPSDSTLQRPDYVGGTQFPVVFSEVLQTSQTTTGGDDSSPLGKLGGHGIAIQGNFLGSYFVTEPGVMMTVMSVTPKPGYNTGIHRSWMRKNVYDLPFVEFAHISEQGIWKGELVFWRFDNGSILNTQKDIFGFQGRYDELRHARDEIHGAMRYDPYYESWHLARNLQPSMDVSDPELGSGFIACVPDQDRILAVPSEPAMTITIGNSIRVARPLPSVCVPGLMDHF